MILGESVPPMGVIGLRQRLWRRLAPCSHLPDLAKIQGIPMGFHGKPWENPWENGCLTEKKCDLMGIRQIPLGFWLFLAAIEWLVFWFCLCSFIVNVCFCWTGHVWIFGFLRIRFGIRLCWRIRLPKEGMTCLLWTKMWFPRICLTQQK